jgi:hypothetical protein
MKTKTFSFISLIITVFLLMPGISFAQAPSPVKATINPVTGPAPSTGTVTSPPSPAPTSPEKGVELSSPSTGGVVEDPSLAAEKNLPLPSNSLVPCRGADCNFDAFATLINNILGWFIDLAVTVATITFTIAGAKILWNPDSDSERTAAKEMFRKTVIGLLIVLLAWIAIHTVISALVKTDTNALRFLSN